MEKKRIMSIKRLHRFTILYISNKFMKKTVNTFKTISHNVETKYRP